MIMKIKDRYLKKFLLILLNILVFLIIIKECKLIGFCYTMITLISPLFLGYVIAWLLKPIMLKFNKKFNTIVSSILTYVLLIIIVGLVGYFFIPVVIKEIKNIIPDAINLYHRFPKNFTNNINLNEIGSKILKIVNDCTSNIKSVILNIFYSLFISYYYLISHKQVSKFIGKYLPSKLLYDISTNLKAFVKGTIIDTVILFILSLVSLYFVKMPYSLLFAIVISLTNVIPYIGPYIGGIPAVLVAFSVNNKIGFMVFILILVLQFIESSIIHPYIMSKSLKISPLFIMIGLIVFSYFFGVFGMLISTPLVSIIKSCYLYYSSKRKSFKKALHK